MSGVNSAPNDGPPAAGRPSISRMDMLLSRRRPPIERRETREEMHERQERLIDQLAGYNLNAASRSTEEEPVSPGNNNPQSRAGTRLHRRNTGVADVQDPRLVRPGFCPDLMTDGRTGKARAVPMDERPEDWDRFAPAPHGATRPQLSRRMGHGEQSASSPARRPSGQVFSREQGNTVMREVPPHMVPAALRPGNGTPEPLVNTQSSPAVILTRPTAANTFPAPPPRPKTPGGYFPTPDAIIDPTEAARHLRNHEHQSPGTPLHVHTLAVDRFPGRDSLHPPQSPTVSVSPKLSPTASISSKLSSKSTSSMKAFTRSATKVFGKGLEKGRSSVSQAGAGLAKAVGVARIEEKPRLAITVPASAIVATPGSLQDLYHGRQLPRLYIPDARAQAGTELSRRLSTDTLDSPTFKSILALSPRSRDLRHQLHEDHSQDIMAEIRNMLSARRRIRKSEFGRAVHEYLMARQNWEDLPSRFDPDDIKLMKEIVQALEDQKLAAEKLVTRHPHLYLGMRHVKERYCSRDVIARG